MIGDSGRDENLIEKETLFLPKQPHLKLLKLLREPRGISSREKADAYRRLAVIHKMSIPYASDRISSKKIAEEEHKLLDPLNKWKDMQGLENAIEEIKKNIKSITRQIRMFERGEDKNKEYLLSEKESKQKRLDFLKKFLDEKDIRIEKAAEGLEQIIQELETKIATFEKKGYKETIRLEEERESVRKKLKTLEKFLLRMDGIVGWQRLLKESKEASLNSFALAKDDPKGLELACKIHGSLIAIENE
jgi:chromosome segregation ATPase